jgi:propanediol utilization protein
MKKETLYKALSEVLRQTRQEPGLSLEEIAKAIYVNLYSEEIDALVEELKYLETSKNLEDTEENIKGTIQELEKSVQELKNVLGYEQETKRKNN